MHIAWEQFTPYSALLGGVLIGIAVVILLAGIGRIAGITGIIAGIFTDAFSQFYQTKKSPWTWRLAFIAGMLLTPSLYSLFHPLPLVQVEADWSSILISGLIVGIGTRLGSGCTSGHGVCGLARLSPRSLVATLAFMGSGFATVFVLKHLF